VTNPSVACPGFTRAALELFHGDGSPQLSAVPAEFQPYRHGRSDRTVIRNTNVDLLETSSMSWRQSGKSHIGRESSNGRADRCREPGKPVVSGRICDAEAGSVHHRVVPRAAGTAGPLGV
jgi:hypothetical protein